MATMTLDNNVHGEGDKHGNANSVVKEALGERYGTDKDIDRSRTKDNLYIGYKSGEELYSYWQEMADNYRVTVGDKTRKLRSDAKIGFAGIIKPQDEYINAMSRQEQIQFFTDANRIVKDIYAKHGMTIDASVIHFDESAPHAHYFGHDEEYKLSDKIRLPLYNDLNREFPKRMRALGYDIADLTGYKEETAGMNADELKQYKAKKREERKTKHGKSSRVYKAEQEAKRILEDAQSASKALESDLRAKEQALALKEQEMALRASQLAQKEQQFDELVKSEVKSQLRTAERRRAQADAQVDSIKPMQRHRGEDMFNFT